MDLQESDIMSSFQSLTKAIKEFRGPEGYIKDAIKRVSSLKPKVRDIHLDDLNDVSYLLALLAANAL